MSRSMISDCLSPICCLCATDLESETDGARDTSSEAMTVTQTDRKKVREIENKEGGEHTHTRERDRKRQRERQNERRKEREYDRTRKKERMVARGTKRK